MTIQGRRTHPPEIETLLWQRSLPTARDRQAVLRPEHIARAAFELAENENLAATSVKRVAGRLGVPATRLELYLPNRQDLLDLMLDVALGEIELPEPDGSTDWRIQLRSLAIATWHTASRHPWLVELIGGRPPTGPHGLRFIERGLAAFAGAPVTATVAAHCLNAVQAYVCGSVRMQDSGRRPAGGAVRNAEYLAQAVAGADYPWLAELFAGSEQLSPESSFEFGLNCILDGIACRLGAAVGIAARS